MSRTVLTLVILTALLIIAGSITYVIYKMPNDSLNSTALKDLAVTDTQVFTDLDGNPLTFEQFEGKVRVVNSWASWTPFSVQELKDLESLALEYKDKDVVVLAINRKEPREHAKAFLSTIMQFSNIHFAIDLSDSFYTSIGGFAMPETVFYDNKGNVVVHKHGDMTLDEMRRNVESSINPQQ